VADISSPVALLHVNQSLITRPAPIRTFHPRRGRLGGRHEDALTRLSPVYGVAVEHVDPAGAFGRRAPLVLEIGSGMGEATVAMAAADPGRDYLAVEVHTPGIANLLARVEEHGLTNVRVVDGDALDLLRRTPPATLDAIHAFFPDPWPKPRHHKRRLIQPDHVALMRSRLVRGGALHCATDWAPYAEAMLATLDADAELVNAFDGPAPRPAHRPRTKFEQRGIDAGREIVDLIFHRA
jgi:tRNA (guanine-N7-)-methyltransferase